MPLGEGFYWRVYSNIISKDKLYKGMLAQVAPEGDSGNKEPRDKNNKQKNTR